jgi:hypothetical protein
MTKGPFQTEPIMSVILPTPDTFRTVAKTLRHLANQTASQLLEVVLVGPDGFGSTVDHSAAHPFHSLTVVEVESVEHAAAAYTRGVFAASGKIVAFAEDHCFPEKHWAEALIQRHEGPWAAVGPCVRNANDVSAISRADMLIAYAPWMEPTQGGPVDFLPGHNSSYKREHLLAYGDDLMHMLAAETLLHWDLRQRGLRLFLEPAAITAHTHFAILSAWVPYLFHSGRVFGAQRARQWHFAKRIAFALASPAIPIVRLAKLWRVLQARSAEGLLLQSLHALVFGFVVDGFGQCAGYAAGAGASPQLLAEFEFHRERFSGIFETSECASVLAR